MKLVILLALVGSISCGFRDHAHRVYIGAAITTAHLNDGQYVNLASQNFNFLTPENEMKIDATEPNQNQFNFGPGDQLVNFANQHNMKVRGHTLVWHSQVPGWMNGLGGDALKNAMQNHISKVAGHYSGKVYAWDVCNEIFNEDGTLRDSIWHRAMGNNFVALAFQAARQADPGAKLYINDYNIEGINAKSNGLYNLVKSLKAQGVPIDGVGFQSHFTVGQIAGTYQANLKRFSDLGLDVAITELDIGKGGQSDQAQGDAYANVIKACLSVQRCVGLTIWGVTDNYSWRSQDQPLPFNSNYQPKAAATSINNSLQ